MSSSCGHGVLAGRQPATVDHAALHRFLREDAERLYGYISSRIPPHLRSSISPDDVLQEVWASAFGGVSRFRADAPGALVRWVTTIASRKLLDAIKAAHTLKRHPQHGLVLAAGDRNTSMVNLLGRVASPERTPGSETSAKEAICAVRLALAALPDERRRAVWMRHIEGRSLAEIAIVMQKTVPAVHGLIFRALGELGDCLGRPGRFFSDADSQAALTPLAARGR